MGNRVKSGLVWITASSVSRNIVSLLQISILTRILDKSDFGVIAVASMFMSFTQMFLDMGISAGILHRQNITKNEYSSLFWLNIIFGFLLTGILFFLSPFVTKPYGAEELNSIVHILCFTILLNSLGNQQRIVCQKNSKFSRIAIIEIITSIITFVVAIVTAYMGYGVFSMAYSTVAGLIFNNFAHLILGLLKDNRLSFYFKVKDVKPFLKIGIYSVGSQILDFFTKELDILIISTTLGFDFLGVYNVAKKVSIAMYRFVSPIIHKVFTPIFAEMNTDKVVLYKNYLNLSKAISFCSMPLYLLIAALSPSIMFFCFGESFIDGAYVQAVFAIMYAFNSFLGICGSLQVATGRTDIGLYWTIFNIFSTAIVYYVSSQFGVTVFLIGILFKVVIDLFFAWFIQFRRMISLKISDYCSIFMWPFTTGLILSIPFYLFFYYPSWGISILGGIFYILCYCLTMWLTPFREYINKIFILIKK